jgi:hypothetical protein
VNLAMLILSENFADAENKVVDEPVAQVDNEKYACSKTVPNESSK